jgi:hypothetical protein
MTLSLPDTLKTLASPSFSIEDNGFYSMTSAFQGIIRSNTLIPSGTFLRSFSTGASLTPLRVFWLFDTFYAFLTVFEDAFLFLFLLFSSMKSESLSP